MRIGGIGGINGFLNKGKGGIFGNGGCLKNGQRKAEVHKVVENFRFSSGFNVFFSLFSELVNTIFEASMPLCVGHGVADALWSCAKQSSLNFPSFTISLGSNTTNFPSLSSFPSPLVFISPFAFLQLMVTPSPERKKERIVIVRVRFRISNEEYRVLQASN